MRWLVANVEAVTYIAGLTDRLGPDRIYPSVASAVAAYRAEHRT